MDGLKVAVLIMAHLTALTATSADMQLQSNIEYPATN